MKKSIRRHLSVRGRRISELDVCFGSSYPKETVPWIRDFELAKSIDDLKTSMSNAGDARIAIAYDRKITSDDVQGFNTMCDAVLSSKKRNASRSHPGSLCKMRIRGLEELKTVLTLHESIRRTLSQAIKN